MSALYSGPVPALVHGVPSVLRQFEALTQERQQLVRGSEPELAPRVDFLDPPGDTTFRRTGVGVELEDKRRSHHMNHVTAPAAHRRESRVQLCVKFALNPFRGCARQEYGSTAQDLSSGPTPARSVRKSDTSSCIGEVFE
jgi:hypothetical protein